MTEKPRYSAPALDKGLDILEILARAGKPMNMAEISAVAGRSRGEIFRMLQVLETREYIARADGGDGYMLTNRLFQLGLERPPIRDIVALTLPIMSHLADEIWQPCHLVVASQAEIVVIARADAPGDLSFIVRVGHRRPMVLSTSGLVLFAFQPEEVRQRWLTILAAAQTPFDPVDLQKRADVVRKRGYARIPSRLVHGVVDLAAPILVNGSAAAVLVVPFLDRPSVPINMTQAVDRLRSAAQDVSAALA